MSQIEARDLACLSSRVARREKPDQLLPTGLSNIVALLTETGAMLPMMALFMLATYRLGRAVGGDMAGGMAALALFATVFMRSIGVIFRFVQKSRSTTLFRVTKWTPRWSQE